MNWILKVEFIKQKVLRLKKKLKLFTQKISKTLIQLEYLLDNREKENNVWFIINLNYVWMRILSCICTSNEM